MVHESQTIPFDDFARHLTQVFDRVRQGNRPVLVDQDGSVFRIELQESPDIWEGYDAETVLRALRASRGLFTGTDTDQFLVEMGAQREQGANRFD